MGSASPGFEPCVGSATPGFEACLAYGGLGCSTQPRLMRYSRWKVEFQRFFTELSVRPGSSLAISAHRLPIFTLPSSRMRSSSSLQVSRVRQLSSWLCHRSRHCLPFLPGMFCAICAHCCVPGQGSRSGSGLWPGLGLGLG